MRLPHQQRGIGMFNLMYILITLAVFGYVGLKLIPVYLESVKIQRAVSSVAEQPGASTQTPRELAFAVVKRLDIDSVTRIKERNWKDYLDIKKGKTGVTITARYSAEVPLFYNLALVARFEHVGGR